MVAFAFEDYGEKTNSRFSTYFEVKYACENMKPIIPLKLYEGIGSLPVLIRTFLSAIAFIRSMASPTSQ